MRGHLRFCRCSLHTWRAHGLNQRQAELRQRSFKGKRPWGRFPRRLTRLSPLSNGGALVCSVGHLLTFVSLPPHTPPRVSKVGQIPAPPSRQGVPSAQFSFSGRGTRAAAAPWRPF